MSFKINNWRLAKLAMRLFPNAKRVLGESVSTEENARRYESMRQLSASFEPKSPEESAAIIDQYATAYIKEHAYDESTPAPVDIPKEWPNVLVIDKAVGHKYNQESVSTAYLKWLTRNNDKPYTDDVTVLPAESVFQHLASRPAWPIRSETMHVADTKQITDAIAAFLSRNVNRDSRDKPMQHDLKCWPQFFDELAARTKKYEIRRDDRDYRELDILYIQEFQPNQRKYTGRFLRARVDFIMRGRDVPAIMSKDYVILDITVLPPWDWEENNGNCG